jgi:hypothetical protein
MTLWPEWQDAIATIDDREGRRAAEECLEGRWRKRFKKSLQEQVLAWLETPAEQRKYRSPLSPRQVQAWKTMRIRACLAARERIERSTGRSANPVPAYMERDFASA